MELMQKPFHTVDALPLIHPTLARYRLNYWPYPISQKPSHPSSRVDKRSASTRITLLVRHLSILHYPSSQKPSRPLRKSRQNPSSRVDKRSASTCDWHGSQQAGESPAIAL
jgi:hypothetical protein